MRNHVLNGLAILLISATITNILLHWIIVCPTLYREGAQFPTGWLPWRIFRELDRYRDNLRARSESLSRYYILLLLRWFNALLAVVLGFWWLWMHYSPPA
jgi:hypothetical protein